MNLNSNSTSNIDIAQSVNAYLREIIGQLSQSCLDPKSKFEKWTEEAIKCMKVRNFYNENKLILAYKTELQYLSNEIVQLINNQRSNNESNDLLDLYSINGFDIDQGEVKSKIQSFWKWYKKRCTWYHFQSMGLEYWYQTSVCKANNCFNIVKILKEFKNSPDNQCQCEQYCYKKSEQIASQHFSDEDDFSDYADYADDDSCQLTGLNMRKTINNNTNENPFKKLRNAVVVTNENNTCANVSTIANNSYQALISDPFLTPSIGLRGDAFLHVQSTISSTNSMEIETDFTPLCQQSNNHVYSTFPSLPMSTYSIDSPTHSIQTQICSQTTFNNNNSFPLPYTLTLNNSSSCINCNKLLIERNTLQQQVQQLQQRIQYKNQEIQNMQNMMVSNGIYDINYFNRNHK